MKKLWIVPLLAAGSLMLAGCSSSVGDISDYESDSESNEGSVEITDACNSIQIESDISDIRLKKGSSFKLEYKISNDNILNWKVENGTLYVKERPKKNFGFFFQFGMIPDSYITLTVPEQEWEKIVAVSDTGDVGLAELSAGQLRAGSDTGDVTIADGIFDDARLENDTGRMDILSSEFTNLELCNDTGDIQVESSQMEVLQAENDTGNIFLKKIQFTQAELENDTGSIEALDCRGEKVSGNNNTGDIQLKMQEIGQMDLENDTGDIKLVLGGEKDDYNFDFESDTGSMRLERGDYGGNAKIDNGSKRTVRMITDTGDAEINFISKKSNTP